MNNWLERITQESAHVPILPLEDLAKLPSVAGDYDAGVYFLWKDGTLQYIGKSRNIPDRINRHIRYLGHGRMTLVKYQEAVPFDRYTCIVVANSMFKTPEIDRQLTEIERAYIVAYPTEFNPMGYAYTT